MKIILTLALALGAQARFRLRGGEEPHGMSGAGQPVALEHLDFNPAARPEDFVFPVTADSNGPRSAGNQGGGGLIQAADSGAGDIAFQGQGISLSHFTVSPGGENLPHYHPRATELLFVYQGTIEVAFTDTAGNLCLNTVVAGQATLFPRALIHYQRNTGSIDAKYISMLDSENPGVMSLPRTFVTLPNIALANSLRESDADIQADKDRVLPSSLNGGRSGYDGAAGPSGNAPVPAFASMGAGLLEKVQSGEISLAEVASSAKVKEGKIGENMYDANVDSLPVSLENLDFNPAATCSDFVFDVTADSNGPRSAGNQGGAGLVQAADSGAGDIAMQGQGISLSHFTVQPGGENLPHYHPRATELLFVYEGQIEVAFTDTTGRLIINTVLPGEATLFPRALIHYQRNTGSVTARYISMLDSENPGVMSIPRVFATLPTVALSNALRAPESEIAAMQARVLPARLLQQPYVLASGSSVASAYDGAAGPNGNAPVPAFGTFTPVDLPGGAPAPIGVGSSAGGAISSNAISEAVRESLATSLSGAIVDGVVNNLNAQG